MEVASQKINVINVLTQTSLIQIMQLGTETSAQSVSVEVLK